jgi:hypothetical protein
VSEPNACRFSSFTADGVSYAIHDFRDEVRRNYRFRNAPWSTRGWTFQEYVLSRRLLVFGDDDAFFYCEKGL